MRRAILFLYHKRPDICLNRILILRRFNPGMAIYGMYGGPNLAAPYLPFNNNYVLPFSHWRFKWQNGDLCARQWFIDCGHKFRFDMLHIVEWDLVCLRTLDKLFQNVRDGVAVTDVKTIHEWRLKNWYWIRTLERSADLEELRSFIRKTYGETFSDERQVAGLFAGASMSRAFLERYAEAEPFARTFLNDEIRMPLFAQAFGMKVHEPGFARSNPYFDCGRRHFSKLPPAVYSRRAVLHHVTDKVVLPR